MKISQEITKRELYKTGARIVKVSISVDGVKMSPVTTIGSALSYDEFSAFGSRIHLDSCYMPNEPIRAFQSIGTHPLWAFVYCLEDHAALALEALKVEITRQHDEKRAELTKTIAVIDRQFETLTKTDRGPLFTLTIDRGMAKTEIAQALRAASDVIENTDHNCGRSFALRDRAGNVCGEYKLKRGIEL